MPRKKFKVQAKPREEKGFLENILNVFKPGESYTNLILGAVVVIAIGIGFLIFIRDNRQETSSTTTEENEIEEEKDKNTSSTYTVKAGDSLWSISEEKYKTGYNWTEIAKVNNLENPSIIEVGDKLKLPNEAETTKPTPSPTISEKVLLNGEITENKYTIKEGDNLWNIAVRAYGNGYRYVEIASANKIANPNLIYPKVVLIIPR